MSRAASVLAAVVLLLGAGGLVLGVPGVTNWLALLFGINAGWAGLSLASLHAVRLVDITVLVLAAAAFAGLWPGPGRSHKLWMTLAIVLPLAGIAVLVVTSDAGRSGLMGGGLVLSFLMLADRRSRPLGLLGLAANALLLGGDFATTGSRAPAVAGAIAVGYLLLIAWFLLIAATLLVARAFRPPSEG